VDKYTRMDQELLDVAFESSFPFDINQSLKARQFQLEIFCEMLAELSLYFRISWNTLFSFFQTHMIFPKHLSKYLQHFCFKSLTRFFKSKHKVIYFIYDYLLHQIHKYFERVLVSLLKCTLLPSF
jgi:hypothetical protein